MVAPRSPRPAPPPAAGAGPTRTVYRIEHRGAGGGAVSMLGFTDDPLARRSTPAPLAARLREAGVPGVLRLVEDGSGVERARRTLDAGAGTRGGVAAAEA